MPMYMGRDKKAGICFQQDTLMSRTQMRFDFADDNWLISDGDGESARSANGVWVFCDMEQPLVRNDII